MDFDAEPDELDVEMLNALKVLGVTGCVASAIRENIYSIADIALARYPKHPIESDVVFKCLFSVNIATFRVVLAIFIAYYEDDVNADHWSVTNLKRIIRTPTGRVRLGYTADRVLMCMFGYYSGLLRRANHARLFGFTDLTAVRKAGSKVLLRALKKSRPIKVRNKHMTNDLCTGCST